VRKNNNSPTGMITIWVTICRGTFYDHSEQKRKQVSYGFWLESDWRNAQMVNQMLLHCEGYQSAARKQQAEFLELRYVFNISHGKSGWHNRHQARRLSFEIFCKYSSFNKIELLLKAWHYFERKDRLKLKAMVCSENKLTNGFISLVDGF